MLETVGWLLAAHGYTQEAERLIGVSKELQTDSFLWEYTASTSKRAVAAARAGNSENFFLYLSLGAPIYGRNMKEAVQGGSYEIIKHIHTKFPDSLKPKHLFYSIRYGHRYLLEPLINLYGKPCLDEIDRKGYTLLMRAAKAGHIESVWYLVAEGADVCAPQLHYTLPYYYPPHKFLTAIDMAKNQQIKKFLAPHVEKRKEELIVERRIARKQARSYY